MGLVDGDASRHTIRLRTMNGSFDGDDVELIFSEYDKEKSIVQVRAEAKISTAPPPFCIKKNCINGNMKQREGLARIQSKLGLPNVNDVERGNTKNIARPKGEYPDDGESKWTPIFFNSDRVPYFDED